MLDDLFFEGATTILIGLALVATGERMIISDGGKPLSNCCPQH